LLSTALCGVALAQLDALPAELCVERVHRLSLAMGDAWLLRGGRYPLTHDARCSELERMAHAQELLPAYRAAIEYMQAPDSFRPQPSLASFVDGELRRLGQAFLAHEAERIQTPRSVFGYLRHPAPVTPSREPPRLLAKARSVALRLPGAGRLALPARERLLRAAVALAFAKEAPACRAHAAGLLRLSARLGPSSDAELAAGLRALARETLTDPVGHPFGEREFPTEP